MSVYKVHGPEVVGSSIMIFENNGSLKGNEGSRRGSVVGMRAQR